MGFQPTRQYPNLLVFVAKNLNFQGSIKTKEISNLLNKFSIIDALIILDKPSKDNIYKAIRNIPNIKVTDINHFSAFDIVKYKKIVFSETSIKELEKRYA